MARRGITQNDVRECLEGYPSKIQTRKKTQYRQVVRGRALKVGVAPDKDTADHKHVTTAMWEGDDDE